MIAVAPAALHRNRPVAVRLSCFIGSTRGSQRAYGGSLSPWRPSSRRALATHRPLTALLSPAPRPRWARGEH